MYFDGAVNSRGAGISVILISLEGEMIPIIKRLKFDHYKFVDPRGLAGGLIMLWTSELDISINWTTDNLICGTVKSEIGNWLLLACYGPVKYREKSVFWEELTDFLVRAKLPWLLFGDLNEIVDQSEKFGGRKVYGKRLFLKQFLQEVGGVDLGFTGTRFTWQGNGVKERLDRAVASSSWIHRFNEAFVSHLARDQSDHSPIVIHTYCGRGGCKSPR